MQGIMVSGPELGSSTFKVHEYRVLLKVLEYECEYFSPFYRNTRVRVQSTQNALMKTLMSTFSY